MARGPRKTVEDKIREKEELIASMKIRIQSEERELNELKLEKRNKELEAITSILEGSGISVSEAKEILERHLAQTDEKTA